MAANVSPWQAVVEWPANILRRAFDGLTKHVPAILLVAGPGVLVLLVGRWLNHRAFEGCPAPPLSFFRLGLTFSAQTFDAMLHSAGPCRAGIVDSFVVQDMFFPPSYAVFLCALYLWVERYRRYMPDEWSPDAAVRAAGKKSIERPIDHPSLPLLSSLIVLLPIVAALLDIVPENLLLHQAASRLSGQGNGIDDSVSRLVCLGSAGAALKWSVLGAYVLGLLVMLLRGPRGVLLWRLRFSVLSVLVGALALLVVPQGQDILQRLVEGSDRYLRVGAAVSALTCTALVVWYYGRVLSLVRLEEEPQRNPDSWMLYFERNVPRLLGVSLLVLAGAAFARAASSLPRYACVVSISTLVIIAVAWLRRRKGRIILLQSLGADLQRALAGVVLGAFIVWPSSISPWAWRYETGQSDSQALRVAAWLAIAAAWFVYVVVYHRRLVLIGLIKAEERKRLWEQELAVGYPAGTLPGSAWRFTGLMLVVSVGLFVAFTLEPVKVGRRLGPLVILSLAVANAVFMGSVLAFFGRTLRLPLVTLLLALAAIFSVWNDNHEIRTIPWAQTSDSLHAGTRLQARLGRWLEARAREHTDSIPVILVAAAGGGLRAAYWSAASLAKLQDRDSTFARHVFAISGVSGGSLGAAVFSAMVRDLSDSSRVGCVTRRLEGGSAGRPRILECVREFMKDDYLSPVLAKMIAPDFFQWFLPVPFPAFDRSMAMEQSWEDSYQRIVRDSTLATGFLAFHRDSSPDRSAPMLLLNTTHVQTGRRYVTAPFPDDTVFLDARSVLRVLDADLPLSTAVHNSARFSYVSPAGRIERRDGVSYGALVDGGYFENSGLATLKDLLAALRNVTFTSDSAAAAARLATFVVLYLCNDPYACRRDLAVDRSLVAQRTAAGEWLSPLTALFRARDARGSLARAEVAGIPGVRFFQLNVCDSLRYGRAVDSTELDLARERVVHPPLGWQLSRITREWMDLSLIRSAVAGPAVRGDSARIIGAPCRDHNADNIDSLIDLLSVSTTTTD